VKKRRERRENVNKKEHTSGAQIEEGEFPDSPKDSHARAAGSQSMQQQLDRSRAELRRLSYMVQSEAAILQGGFKNIQPRTSKRLEMKQTEWMKTQPGEDDCPVGTYPLVIKTSGTGQLYYDYKPWSSGHLDIAAKQLPHLSKRADRWIPTLETVIASHHQLCLGDLIALMAKVLTPGQCDTNYS
jgi:hypothetical protein